MRALRSKTDLLTGLVIYAIEIIATYAYGIFKEVHKGPQITSQVDSKEEIKHE